MKNWEKSEHKLYLLTDKTDFEEGNFIFKTVVPFFNVETGEVKFFYNGAVERLGTDKILKILNHPKG